MLWQGSFWQVQSAMMPLQNVIEQHDRKQVVLQKMVQIRKVGFRTGTGVGSRGCK